MRGGENIHHELTIPDIEFKGTITISVTFKSALGPPGTEVRFLHYTGSGLEELRRRVTLI